MMRYQDSASFVYGIAKRARKYYLGMTTATQDVEDFLSTDYGKAVLTNSSIQMLLKQGTAEVDLISKTFFLSEGERELLISADVGEGLFFAGQNHVAMKVIAAAFEHEIATSNPIELSKRAEDKKISDLAFEEANPTPPAEDLRLSGITPALPTETPIQTAPPQTIPPTEIPVAPPAASVPTTQTSVPPTTSDLQSKSPAPIPGVIAPATPTPPVPTG